MGYYTDFDGCFSIKPYLQPRHAAYLEAFLQKRHCRYDEKMLQSIPDPLREAVELPVGPDGLFSLVVEEADTHWLEDGIALEPKMVGLRPGLRLDVNAPASGVPHLYCQWQIAPYPNTDPTKERWELSGPAESSKFYGYNRWLVFLLKHFFMPWGYVLNGEVRWAGENVDDRGRIDITRNAVRIDVAEISYRNIFEFDPAVDNEIEATGLDPWD